MEKSKNLNFDLKIELKTKKLQKYKTLTTMYLNEGCLEFNSM